MCQYPESWRKSIKICWALFNFKTVKSYNKWNVKNPVEIFTGETTACRQHLPICSSALFFFFFLHLSVCVCMCLCVCLCVCVCVYHLTFLLLNAAQLDAICQILTVVHEGNRDTEQRDRVWDLDLDLDLMDSSLHVHISVAIETQPIQVHHHPSLDVSEF